MNKFTSVKDVPDVAALVARGLEMKKNKERSLAGQGLTLAMVFMNPSLRTRLSTYKAAKQLGMDVVVVNLSADGWALEYEDGVIMNGNKAEHVKDAAAMLGLYCDILAIRCFPSLTDKKADYEEYLLNQFIKYAGVPVVSMESATLHPLQSLADLITIAEQGGDKKPKVVLTWAPHIKPLPQAVANSFAEWTLAVGYNLTIAHPQGYELSSAFTAGAHITHNQQEALAGADFVYVKNWSSYEQYGKILPVTEEWMLSEQVLEVAPNAHIMHCLPVRRNLELADELLDGPRSLTLTQAQNRLYAAQAVLEHMIKDNF